MVVRHRDSKMASEQPVKKKLRRDDDGGDEDADETDFRSSDLSSLHLTLPLDVNEAEITRNAVNFQLHSGNGFRTDVFIENANANVLPFTFPPLGLVSGTPASACRDEVAHHERPSGVDKLPGNHCFVSVIATNKTQSVDEVTADSILDDFQTRLSKNCLCGLPDAALPFCNLRPPSNCNNGDVRIAVLSEWPKNKTLSFLSNLQLLFDVYLKQNSKGHICSRVAQICEAVACNELNLIEQLIALRDTGDRYLVYLSARVLSSFLVVAKTNINVEWLESILHSFTADTIDCEKIDFALEVVKRVVEWKDVEIHVLEESQLQNATTPGPSSAEADCITVSYSDAESFDTCAVKGLLIKSLESKWSDLISKIQYLITNNSGCVRSQTCILTFLALWESIISVRANLSVIDTKPFYTHLEIFVALLNSALPALIWKQLLSLFNEVLCYGSTLALQDMLPDDTCQLAHLIVRYVKDYRLLDSLPFRRGDGYTINVFAGTVVSGQTTATVTVDKTLLQKMILLVLKSVAITIKETRSDSSDSSVGSDDYDFYQDMQLIERSIRDVLKKVDVFVKNSLDFHPETPFSKMVVHLFKDQDDYLIESMVCTLDITVGISYRNAVYPDLISMLNPTHSFVEFLKVVAHDSDILLDYLVSNETCFLLYLLRFLKYTRRNWSKFVTSCGEAGLRNRELDDTMTVLIRLKLQINRLVSKELFPYNITPVLRLLDTCENLYEGNEFS